MQILRKNVDKGEVIALCIAIRRLDALHGRMCFLSNCLHLVTLTLQPASFYFIYCIM